MFSKKSAFGACLICTIYLLYIELALVILNHNNCCLLCHLLVILKDIFANSVDLDQTAPLRSLIRVLAVYAKIGLKRLQEFSRRHKQTNAGSLGILKVKPRKQNVWSETSTA